MLLHSEALSMVPTCKDGATFLYIEDCEGSTDSEIPFEIPSWMTPRELPINPFDSGDDLQ